MSTPFTTPAGQTWQTLLSEITLAYSERRQAIGQSAYVPEDRDVQSSAYWRTLQGWLESYCTSFIDHANGPLTDAGDAFAYFTLDNWRAAAGLNVNGFRRSPLTGGTAYGQMQKGDAIGPWIFEELQKGFGALQWSQMIYPNLGSCIFKQKISVVDNGVYAATEALAMAGWPTASVTDVGSHGDPGLFYCSAFSLILLVNVEGSHCYGGVGRYWTEYQLTLPVGATCEWWNRAIKYGGASEVFDTQGDPNVVEGVFSLYYSQAVPASATTVNVFAYENVSPSSWPFVPVYARSPQYAGYGGYVDTGRVIAKWDFTNA